MYFDNLFKNQKQVIQIINNSFNKNRLVNSYLFNGPKGCYKMEAALYFASLLLCENKNACGKCSECKKILKGVHPNVFIISADGDTIKKEQIERLEDEFSLTSERVRVFIINGIEKMTIASANTMLKFLEECKENAYGILLTENVNMVLATVKSRCQVINFLNIDYKIVRNELIKEGIGLEESNLISIMTSSLEEGKALSNDDEVIKIIDLATAVGSSFENKENAIIILNTKGKFLLNESDKKYHNYFVDLLIAFQNDKIKHLLNQEDIVFSETIKKLKITLTQHQEIQILELLLSYKQRMRYNIAFELMYLEMLIAIERI